MTCPISKCTSTSEHLCNGHTRQLATLLRDIHTFHREAHFQLIPQQTGEEKTKSRELTLGVNVNALSFINANDIYIVLGGWERVIRSERQLAPIGLLPPVRGVDDEVARLTLFHQNQLPWTASQGWIEAYYSEVKDLHNMGMGAAKAFTVKKTRIHCPTDTSDGKCSAYLTLNPDDPLEVFECRKCGHEWNTLRLIAVAQEDRSRPLWVDIETAAHIVNRSVSQIRRVAFKIHGKRRRSELVNLHAILDFYAA